ncbi:2-hydroxyacyl-CoA lyase 2, partial [Geodia barretti]
KDNNYNDADAAQGRADIGRDSALSDAGTRETTRWRGADSLVRAMEAGGVGRVFALSGNQIMSVFDAAIDSGVELLHVRHEAAAVHMADAFGRLTGRPGVALVTAGPGFANTLSALYVARMAESPLILLSGRAPHRGQCRRVPADAPGGHGAPRYEGVVDARRGSRSGTGAGQGVPHRGLRPSGPVHLALPVDLLEGDAPSPAGVAGPTDFEPTDLGALADVLPDADTVLLLGKKLDFSLKMGRPPSFASGCRFLQIDAEEFVIEQARSVVTPPRPVASVVASPVDAAESMVRSLQGRRFADAGWGREVEDAVDHRPASWDSVEAADGEPLHPLQVARVLRDTMSGFDDPVFVSDGGEFGQWAQAVVSAGSRVINGPSGAIGGGVPFALGARAARPGSTVLLTIGDGSFGYHAMEIDTAVRCGLPFVAVVGNDASWNAEYQIQLREYGEDRLYGCELLHLLADVLTKYGAMPYVSSRLPLRAATGSLRRESRSAGVIAPLSAMLASTRLRGREQPGEQGALFERELIDFAVKVQARRRLNPVGTGAEIDRIEVHSHYLGLGVQALD